jgi:hypothetical protein
LGARAPLRLIAGQSAEVSIQPARFLYYLELDANKAPFATSTTGSLHVPFTAPFGVGRFELNAFGSGEDGPMPAASETVRVVPDPGRTISGYVTDANGVPVAGAEVTWEAQGLSVEYYGLEGGPLVRPSFLSALNYPNPSQVFGADPMGVGIGKEYSARLRGRLQLAAEGLYQFGLLAHAGGRLTIDGRLVAEASATGVDAAQAEGSAILEAGAHEIEVTHFESGGAAALQLLWTPPGGVRAVVPPAAILSEAPAAWRVRTASDGRFELRVPAALDGVVVKLAAGSGSVQVDQ